MGKTPVVTLEERMQSEAEFGLFYYYAEISKRKAEELRKEGLDVRDSKEKKTYPRLHRISWEWSGVEGEISTLDENSEEYSFAKKLWIIATKVCTK